MSTSIGNVWECSLTYVGLVALFVFIFIIQISLACSEVFASLVSMQCVALLLVMHFD